MPVEGADVLVIGSGMGGATFAAGLAPSGAKILILERGERLADSEAVRDARAIFQQGVFRPRESWLDGAGQAFNPGNYYYVGGNTKLYGAVLIRYRAQDFGPIVHRDGTTPGWPFPYEELEPWYSAAERLYRVRGALGFDPHRAAAFETLSIRPGAGRTGDRKSARALEGRRPEPVSIAARHRHRQMDATRENAMGRISRRRAWQDGRRELRRRGSIGAPERRASHQRSRRSAACRAWRRAYRRSRGLARGRAQYDRRESRRARCGRRQFSRAAAPIRRQRPCKSFRRGRSAFHEPQRVRGGGDRSAGRQRLGLSEDPRDQ